MRPAQSKGNESAPGCAANGLFDACARGDRGEERIHFPALPPGGKKPPVAHKAKLLPGGERFRRGLHRFQTASERRVVFAVPRGIRRAGGARRGRIASVREILPEDGFRPAVRADRAGGGIKILREPLENAAETGERFRRFRRRRRLRRLRLRGRPLKERRMRRRTSDEAGI